MSQRRCAPRAGFAAIFVGVVTLLFTIGCGRSGLDADELLGEVGAGGSGAGGVSAGGLTGRGGSSGGALSTGGRQATGGFGNAGAGGFGNGGASTGGRASGGAGGRPIGGAGGRTTGGVPTSGAGGVTTGGAPAGGAGGVSTGGVPSTGGSPSDCASFCTAGCCDALGRCQPGDSANACGNSGARCLDCGSSGFGCVNSVCQGPPPKCGPSNCAGCCDTLGRCRTGDDIDACGSGGLGCLACGTSSLGCSEGACQGAPPACSPLTCGGCCTGAGVCVIGTSDAACGTDGDACENCGTSGRECNQPGSYCTFVPTCSATTCPEGCCDSTGTCRNGRTDAACGVSGQQCQSCATSGQHCAAAGFCYAGPHCGPDTCGGCCTANGQCVPGANNARCGAYGALCDNCANQGETCQGGACGVPGATCPAPYGGCNPGVQTTPPVLSPSCTSGDLSALASACNGPRASAACRAELASLLRASPGCFDCLQPFLNPAGVAACLSPFLNSTCNHDLTCSLACTNVACGSCPAGETEGCQDQAFMASGSCRAYVNGNYCAMAAFGGPGAFCDLERIGDVGVWLEGVGAYYCSR